MTKTLKIFGIFLLSGVGIMFVWWTYLHSKYSQYLPEFTVIVDSDERRYHLYAPETFDAEPQDVLVFFQGGNAGSDGAWLVPQQQRWEELAAERGIILAIPQGKVFFDNEGAWQLNTHPGVMHDVKYIDAMLDDILTRHKFELGRVYGVGYSLGSMFAYEIACHMSTSFVAIASFSGTMPVSPRDCNPESNVPIMHVHGVDDPVIQYSKRWDWKAWDSVGTMQDVPRLIQYWVKKFNCTENYQTDNSSFLHSKYSNCDQNSSIEHYALLDWGHDWPSTLNGTSTHLKVWQFLDKF